MSLTIADIANNPLAVRFEIQSSQNEKFILRPLEQHDEHTLLDLLHSLSEQTKRFYSYTDPLDAVAKEMCDAINKYDKVRFVLENTSQKELVGLFEFSMDIPANDLERFEEYNIHLDSKTDCRIAPLLRDAYQSKGLATVVLPILVKIAQGFERNRIMLWGGVLQNNPQAIRFYEKNGFKKLGKFMNEDHLPSYDMILELKK